MSSGILRKPACHASGSWLMDYSYTDTIMKYGFKPDDHLTDAIETANLELTKAALTHFIRQERFCDGLRGRAVREGVFSALLKRLRNWQA